MILCLKPICPKIYFLKKSKTCLKSNLYNQIDKFLETNLILESLNLKKKIKALRLSYFKLPRSFKRSKLSIFYKKILYHDKSNYKIENVDSIPEIQTPLINYFL